MFARERLRELGAPLAWERVHVLPPPVTAAARRAERGPASAPYALVVSRLSPEKGVDVAIDACRIAGIAAGHRRRGPRARRAARARARAGTCASPGGSEDGELARAAGRAAIALVPSRSAETFGLAAAEAMAAGLPVAASRVGALPELVEDDGLVPPGDAAGSRGRDRHARGRPGGGRARGAERVRALCAPEVVAGSLARIYDGREPAGANP